MKFWIVTMETHHVICTAQTRERAKQEAYSYMGGNPDKYTVTPLTNPGESVRLNVTAWV